MHQNNSLRTFDNSNSSFIRPKLNSRSSSLNSLDAYGGGNSRYNENKQESNFVNKSVDYGNNQQRFNERANTTQNMNVVDRNSSYDPFESIANRKRTTRQQRLKQKDADKTEGMPQITQSRQTIYYPGEMKLHDDTRENDRNKMNKSKDRGLNHSQNHLTNYNSNLEESPQFRENRIQEAYQDHSRENVEQSRYMSRLELSNRRQRAVFADHYKKYIIPTAKMINNKKIIENQRVLEAKNRMEALEIEQDNNQFILKQKYSNYLKNQMAEKIKLQDQARESKLRMYEHMEYKRKMFQDEQLQSKIEKKREQEELSNILANQTMYKQLSPTKEPTIKPYVDKYETCEPDKIYTLGGFEYKGSQKTGYQKKTRRQNTYISPNPIVNPMNDYNIYIRQQIADKSMNY